MFIFILQVFPLYIPDQLKNLVAIKPVEQFAEDVEPMEENTENQKLGQNLGIEAHWRN